MEYILDTKEKISNVPKNTEVLKCYKIYLTSLKDTESLVYLREINCSFNYLTSLNGLERLNSLEVLNCSHNSLDGYLNQWIRNPNDFPSLKELN